MYIYEHKCKTSENYLSPFLGLFTLVSSYKNIIAKSNSIKTHSNMNRGQIYQFLQKSQAISRKVFAKRSIAIPTYIIQSVEAVVVW